VKYFLHREIFGLDTIEPAGVETDFATLGGYKAGVRLSALLQQNDQRKPLAEAKTWRADCTMEEWAS
jgi:hypothetical protein